MKTIRLLGFSLLLIRTLSADVVLAPLFQDHVVLQRDKPLAVWGTAEAGENVTVVFAKKTASATTNLDGKWQVMLPAMPTNAVPETLVVTGHNKLTVSDVLVGEVWLCSGQSNMAFMLSQTNHAADDIAKANYPLIRHFKVKLTVGDQPQSRVEGEWIAASPATAGAFTAVGYFFGLSLFRELNVPIGLINSTWGGVPVEPWIPAETLAADPKFSFVKERWQHVLENFPKTNRDYHTHLATWESESAAAKAEGKEYTKAKPLAPAGPGARQTPSGLYNGMIHPLIPFTLRGVIWYQGEGNVTHAKEYSALFGAMITAWRERFKQGEFPFYWVQLPNFKNAIDPTGMNWAWLREQQMKTLKLPHTDQAVIIELGNPDNIHPTNKEPVGERLARLAKDQVYGRPMVTSGPRVTAIVPENGAIRVTFNPVDSGKLMNTGETVLGFSVAGDDHVFHPAMASIEGNSVVVRATDVAKPLAVRYAWENNPTATLKNSAGLPAAPFRSDDW